MKLVLLAVATLYWLEMLLAEPAYQSSGWRPQGQSLNPCYLPPAVTKTRTTSTNKQREQTTPRSREPTTTTTSPRNDANEDDSSEELGNEQTPALAVANSFAFNRPIYVYNAYPYHPSSAYFLRG